MFKKTFRKQLKLISSIARTWTLIDKNRFKKNEKKSKSQTVIILQLIIIYRRKKAKKKKTDCIKMESINQKETENVKAIPNANGYKHK